MVPRQILMNALIQESVVVMSKIWVRILLQRNLFTSKLNQTISRLIKAHFTSKRVTNLPSVIQLSGKILTQMINGSQVQLLSRIIIRYLMKKIREQDLQFTICLLLPLNIILKFLLQQHLHLSSSKLQQISNKLGLMPWQLQVEQLYLCSQDSQLCRYIVI